MITFEIWSLMWSAFEVEVKFESWSAFEVWNFVKKRWECVTVVVAVDDGDDNDTPHADSFLVWPASFCIR